MNQVLPSNSLNVDKILRPTHVHQYPQACELSQMCCTVSFSTHVTLITCVVLYVILILITCLHTLHTHAQGRTFPVDIFYSEKPVPDYVAATIDTIFDIHATTPLPGDVLAFLTGQDEVLLGLGGYRCYGVYGGNGVYLFFTISIIQFYFQAHRPLPRIAGAIILQTFR
jgi:hypothetical protein